MRMCLLGGNDEPVTASTHRLPNFFIAGAPKAGTTSLYFYVAQHPQVFMSPVKEPTYFGADDVLFGPDREGVLHYVNESRSALRAYLDGPQLPGAMYWVLEWEDYIKLFRDAGQAPVVGEASVSYFWLPNAARSIHACVPDARFVFVLRDPAERLFARFQGLVNEPHPTFREFFQAAVDRRDNSAAHLDVGNYASYLRRFLGLFPREHVRIYLYEDYCTDAASLLSDLFAFLDVDPHYPIDLSRRYNPTLVPRFHRLHAIRRRVFKNFRSARWIPERSRRLLKRLYRKPRSPDVMSAEDRAMAIEHYRDQIVGTSELIDRDLSAWLR